MGYSPLIDRLIESFRCLPGIGPKSAQRMALYVLERNREGGRQLSDALMAAIDGVGHCQRCRTLSETDLCTLCASKSRDERLLCVIETPADLFNIDKATGFRGLYFVLMGHLSPLDGIGPEQLGLEILAQRLDEGVVQEMIIATNPTVEGEATAHYLGEMARKRNIQVTRIAHGVPMGGELEYIDQNTLALAFADRREM